MDPYLGRHTWIHPVKRPDTWKGVVRITHLKNEFIRSTIFLPFLFVVQLFCNRL